MHMRSSAKLSKVHYWLQDKTEQNFGDYLTEFFLEYLFLPTPSEARGIHLVGSVLDDMFVSPEASQDKAVVFWGCGLRKPDGLSEGQRSRAQVLAVRGPLSRSQLRLGAHIPCGDPGFLVAALYEPKPASAFAGRSLCIPHFLDQRTDADLLALTGCDLVLRPNIAASLEAIGPFIDAIAAADFVLTASLHGAVMAAAYRKPFAFWDSGNIDLPFKWADLAASMGLACTFQNDLDGAKAWYAAVESDLRLPEAWRLLINPPLLIRPEALLLIARHYTSGPDAVSLATFAGAFGSHGASSARFAERIRLYIKTADAVYEDRDRLAARGEAQQAEHAETARHLADKIARYEDRDIRQGRALDEARNLANRHREDADQARAELSRLAAAKTEIDEALAHLQEDHRATLSKLDDLSHQLMARDRQIADLHASTSWRITGPMRLLATWCPGPARLLRAAARTAWRAVTLPWPRRRTQRTIPTTAPPPPSADNPPADTGGCVPESAAKDDNVNDTVPPSRFCLGNGNMPKALIIDSRYPRTDRDSGSLDAFNMIRTLQSFGYDVLFAATAEYDSINAYGVALQNHGVTVITAADFDSLESFLHQHGPHITLAILSRVECGGLYIDHMRRLAPQARVIFNTVDLHHIRMEREAALTDNRPLRHEASRLEERERYLIRMADVTFVAASSDRDKARSLVPGADIILMPIARCIPGRRAGFQARHRIGFIGGFEHAPNLDAVRYFLDEIWPKVRARLPDAKFHIIGADMPPWLCDLTMPGVDIVGFVPELDPWLDRLRLTVAPLRYGAGAKGKVVSSFSFGLPCVMSPMAAEGMEIDGPAARLLADEPDTFASIIARLYQDPAEWQLLSDACLTIARQRHSLGRGRRILSEVLGQFGLPAEPMAIAA